MHNFSWVVPDHLAGMGYPMAEDAEVLKELGISGVVSLTIRKPDELEGLRVLRIPIPDMASPSVDDLSRAVAFMREVLAGGGRVAVHCGAGVGRTGTVLAAYLVAKGMTPEEARAKVRELRPGSIETPEQERALDRYARLLAEEKA